MHPHHSLGRDAIPSAKLAFQWTHFDLSPNIASIAREKSQSVTNLEFVEGNGAELKGFADRSFDLVLNMDGAVSFSGSKALEAIQETCRVAKNTAILTVSHQAQMVASWVSSSLSKTGQLGLGVDAMLARGEWHQEQFSSNKILSDGLTQNYLGSLKAFSPGELRKILEGAGMQVLRCGGLGSLAGLCAPEALLSVLKDGVLLEEFLSICERFDREILAEGPGTRQRAGLIAVVQHSVV
jgi:hypothetical protein